MSARLSLISSTYARDRFCRSRGNDCNYSLRRPNRPRGYARYPDIGGERPKVKAEGTTVVQYDSDERESCDMRQRQQEHLPIGWKRCGRTDGHTNHGNLNLDVANDGGHVPLPCRLGRSVTQPEANCACASTTPECTSDCSWHARDKFQWLACDGRNRCVYTCRGFPDCVL